MQNHQTQSYFLNSEKNKRSMGQQRNHVSIRNCGMEIEQLHTLMTLEGLESSWAL